MKNLIRNAIRTPDGTVIESANRHNFVCHEDANGKKYCVDGGLEYARRVFDDEDFEDLSLYDNEPHAVQREVLRWGTRGKNGDMPLTYVKISEMSLDHIIACLETQPHMSFVHKKCMYAEYHHRTGKRYEASNN